MHSEMNQIIELVKAQPNKSVEEVVKHYFDGITWSTLKDEFQRMSKSERKKLFHKLTVIRNIHSTQKALRNLTKENKSKT
ncbi:MAG: hypothetical protein ACJ8R9_10765 [Steroidobacteraceae bacterium]